MLIRMTFGISLIMLLVFSCQKAAEEDDSDASDSDSKGAGKLIVGEDDPLDTLNLSDSVSSDVPDSVSASGDGVTAGTIAVSSLTSQSKSREACMIRQKIKEAKMNEEMMALDLCYIEAQKGMKSGGKYKMTFSGGPAGGGDMGEGPGGEGPGGDYDEDGGPGGDYDEGGLPALTTSEDMTMSVFLDNSDPKKYVIYMCESDKLTQKIVIDTATDKGSKGRYKSVFESDGFKVAMQGTFDNGVTEKGRHTSSSQMQFEMKMGSETMTARSNMFLSLAEKAISVVKVANEFAVDGGEFSGGDKEIGTALIGPNLGAALFQRSFSDSGDAMFDDAGGA
jgi:hypothetical protein